MADRISYEVDFSAKGAQTLWNEFLAGSESAGRALNQALGGRVKKELFIETVVDDSGVKRLVAGEREVLTELQKIINLQEKANRTQQGSVTSLRQQVNEAKQARDGMVKYASAADGVNGKLSTINAAWAAQNQRVKDLQKQLDVAGASNVWQKLAAEYNLKGLASAGRQITELVNVFQSVSIIVGQVIGSVNQLFDALQKLQSIKLTFQGIGAGGDVGAVFSESNRIALGLGVSLNTVRDAFQQLSPVILATGGNIGDVSAITESLSSRFVTFGLSADKSRRVMNGVVQAFSKGKLMAEELTQQISEADPAFRTDLANAIGVSVKELGEMVKAGEITNQVLLEAIPRMSKASGLFGKLGASALDAAAGFRDGSVTVEQFRAQLGNIEQLALEDLVNPDTGALQPLLASLADLRAVVTDVAVAFAGSEVFKTFLNLLGQVASAVSVTVQAIVKIGSVIASITQPVFSAINAIDSFGGLLKGFGIISTTVAAVIVTKLIASLIALGSGAIVGAATAAINGLTAAVTLLNAKGLAGLANNIATAIVQLLGLNSATTASAGAQAAATASTSARTVATGLLSKALGIQAAKEALLAAASGGAATAQVRTAGGIVITGTAAAGATPPVTSLTAATTGLAAATSAVLAPLVAIGAVIAAVAAGYLFYNAVIADGAKLTADFGLELGKIQATAKQTKQAILDSASGVDEYTAKIEALDKAVEKTQSRPPLALDFIAKGGGSQAVPDILETANVDNLVNAAKAIGSSVKAEIDIAKKAVDEYNAATDKSGTAGELAAAKIKAAEAVVTSALNTTKAKRDELIAQAEKDIKEGKTVSPERIQSIKLYDEEIKKLEEQKAKFAEVRAEARKKGIPVPIELDIQDADTILTGFGEKVKGLKAQVVLETNPEKRAQLQGELNALKANLEFLQGDITEITIEAQFKVNTRTLKDAADISQATLDNYKAIADKAQAVYNLETGKVSGKESDRRKELDAIKERLDAEKEIRKEKIEEAKEEGASKAQISALEKQDRAAEKAGKAELLVKENELKALADQKKQIEFNALNAKKAALPAQQAAERESLNVAQQLAKLELERLKNAATRARNEAILLQTKTGNEISQARLDGDKAKEKTLIDQYNLLGKNIELLKQEEASLERSRSSQENLFNLQKSTLGAQQESARLGVDAELAALGTQTATQGTAAATQATAAAGSNTVSNAKQLAALASRAAGAQGQVAAATQLTARAGSDAVSSAQQMATSAENAATAAGEQLGAQQDLATASQTAADGAKDLDQKTGDAQESTDDAATAAGTFGSNMQTAAGWAKSVSDTLTALDGTEVNFSVSYTGTQGLWTGGPTVGGQTYRINELGKEGFLSSSGTLSPINKPRNALWKAPGRGMVIPAHIMSKLDVPTGRVSTGVRPSAVGTGGNGLTKIARAIQAALSQSKAATKAVTTGSEDNDLVKIARDIRKTLTQSNTVEGSTAASNPGNDSLISIARDIQSTLSQPNKSDSALQEMAAVQAHQALQIGKLSRAVTKLADKDWNVNVGVRNTGSTAYLDALNRRM